MNPLSNHTSINSASNTVEHNQQHRSNKRGGNKYPFPQRSIKELSTNKVLSSGSSRSLGSDNDSSCSPSIVTTSNSPRNCCNMMEHQPFSSFPTPVSSSLSNGLDGLEPYDRMHDSMTSSSSTNLKTTMMDSNTTLLSLLSSSTSSPQEEDSHLIPLGEDILLDEQPQEGYGQDKGDESSPTWTSVDDKEFQELITFLSAKDDNIQKYLFES